MVGDAAKCRSGRFAVCARPRSTRQANFNPSAPTAIPFSTDARDIDSAISEIQRFTHYDPPRCSLINHVFGWTLGFMMSNTYDACDDHTTVHKKRCKNLTTV